MQNKGKHKTQKYKKISVAEQSPKVNIKCRSNTKPYDGPVGFDSIRPGFNYVLKYR